MSLQTTDGTMTTTA